MPTRNPDAEPPKSAPLENSYWVPGTSLLAGEYPGARAQGEAREKLGALLDAGVTVFFDLTETGELAQYDELLRSEAAQRGIAVDHRRHPVRDVTAPDAETMRRILDDIDAALDGGRTAYVHCWGGVGRTGTVVGCHLVRRGLDGERALAEVSRLFATMSPAKQERNRNGSPETDTQRDLVRRWQEVERATQAQRAGEAARPDGTLTRAQRVRGCLLGGAVGDALGAPVEFLSLDRIRQRYGEGGIGELDHAYGRVGAITDDTQMTLFTAEGLLRARVNGGSNPVTEVHRAYLRWLRTQGGRPLGDRDIGDGRVGLLSHRDLHARRAPGSTCLAALAGGVPGRLDQPLNHSKGCGGVMRAAPAGILPDGDAFDTGVAIAALTHGHPSGYYAAGALALIIQSLLDGAALDAAVAAALQHLHTESAAAEVADALSHAVAAAHTEPRSASTVERLGGGWVAEQALAIAVYAALAAEGDFETGVRLAVNHGGDSDSTGAIAGNILGALLGEEAVPPRWLDQLELRDVIAGVAEELALA